MNEEKLITLFEQKLLPLMKEHFPTKAELQGLISDWSEFKTEMREFKLGMFQWRKDADNKFNTIDDKLDTLVDSANALDLFLEQHPLERIQRVERCVNLGPYVATWQEDDF
ncbi:MAG: hypothetical protein JWL80_371 [Parcubacteria group bacterium]|nr:hypothetical protein [Parcubacteria group bacterium]